MNLNLTLDLSSLSEGIYGLTLTDNNGCQNLISVSVQQPSLFEVNILGDTSVCFGSSLILTADNGDDFIWSTGETNQYYSTTSSSSKTRITSCGDEINLAEKF